jgi:phosphate transport system permease protein
MTDSEKPIFVMKTGDPFIWLSGGALALVLVLLFGLFALIIYHAAAYFWPSDVYEYLLKDGRRVIGELKTREEIPDSPGDFRIQIRQGNRDLLGADFVWLDESEIEKLLPATDVMTVERTEWGRFFGDLIGVRVGVQTTIGPQALAVFEEELSKARETLAEIESLRHDELAPVATEKAALSRDLRSGSMGESEQGEVEARLLELSVRYKQLDATLRRLSSSLSSKALFATSSSDSVEMPIEHIVRWYQPNKSSLFEKTSVYFSRVWEFVSSSPRESNTEGGVWPAIFGTVMMVFVMSIIVSPLGVIAAIYLREYATQGRFVSFVRISVNNLAGVPSIVFGVFGVGFFIYFLGGSLDRLFFADNLPNPTFGTGGILWASLTLALLTLPTVIVSVEEGLASIPRQQREAAYALGATKFEMIWRVILPALMPSMLTGLILAISRAAGEVAPLMITGVVKLAPSLPIDGNFPFVHMERKFMHLGFHIYDVGFQSPNVDAARPMVYTTTLLLLIIVVSLNLVAVYIRNRIQKGMVSSSV